MASLGGRVAGAMPSTRTGRVRLGASVALGVGVAVAAAMVQPWTSTSYDIRDSGVWITKANNIGRVNGQIAQIDYVGSAADDPQILQDGRQIYVVVPGDGASSQVLRLDAADPLVEPVPFDVAGDAVFAVRGGTLVANAAGDVSVLERAGDGPALEAGEPVMELGERGRVSVADDGSVAGVDPEAGRLLLLRPGADNASSQDLAEIAGEFDVTFVGSDPVVLDRGAKRLLQPGREPVDLGDLPGELSLQWPGPDADAALVASSEGLVALPLGGGDAEVLIDGQEGRPVRPAADRSCRYGSWGNTRAVAVCGDEVQTVELSGGDRWRFRAGGPAVILNEAVTGDAYLVVDGELTEVGPWPEDVPRDDEDPKVERTEPDPDGTNPPVAIPDVGEARLYARPGRVTYLDVLRNDFDRDGDVLSVVDDLDTDDERLTVAQGGRYVAFDLSDADDAAPGARFRYRATDGGAESGWAEAQVDIVTDDGHRPERIPGQLLSFDVVAGQRVTYDVLSAFWDPDDDPMYLHGIGAVADGHFATADPSGFITFWAGERTGTVTVPVDVRDDRGLEAAPTSVTVQVLPAGGEAPAPMLAPDFVIARAGVPITITPLTNDLSPTGAPLVLGEVKTLRPRLDALGAITRDPDQPDSVTLTPPEPGRFMLDYRATAGGVEARSTIALVVEGSERPPPEAVPDVVLVKPSSSASVDLLANDSDPGGSLISVIDVVPARDQDPDAARQISWGLARDYRTFTVDALSDAQPGTSIRFEYRIDNSAQEVASTVTVIVIAPTPNATPRVVARPRVPVRGGEVAKVPLSSFVIDPDGDPLTMAIVDQPAGDRAASGGDSLRYFAPRDARTEEVVVGVEVREPLGQPVYAEVVFVVSPADPERNRPPVARDLEARVRAGQSVVIKVPTDGLDPDGDAVRLQGQSGIASLRGTVTPDLAKQTFTYAASERTASGQGGSAYQETFAYQVVDALGAKSAPASVRIQVLPAVDQPRPPLAITDRVRVGVGRTVFVQPTRNDTDLDGDLLGLDPDSVERWLGRCEHEEEDGGVRIQAPDERGECLYSYGVTKVDADGVSLSEPVLGWIVVQVLEDFGGLPPIARDDVALASAEDAVRVPILENDEDPDGAIGDLEVTLIDAPLGARIDEETGEAVVPVLDEQQRVRYRIRDADDLTADAVIWVPGQLENRPPQLRGAPPVEIQAADAGQAEEVRLIDHITDPDGDEDLVFLALGSRRFDNGILGSRLGDGVALLRTPTRDYVGPANLDVVVTDDPDDPSAAVTLQIPVEITTPDNRPPTWTSSPCSGIEKGAKPRTIPLDRFVDEPDVDQRAGLRFGGGGTRGGIVVEVSRDGGLSVTATEDSVTGRTEDFELWVDDGAGSGRVTRTCTVRVDPTSRPAIVAADATRTVEQGKELVVDVSEFVAVGGGGQIEIVDLTVLAGADKGSEPRPQGSRFTYRPKADASGEVKIRYQVRDELDDATAVRRASAVVTVNVVGVPDQPVGVVATAVEGFTIDVRMSGAVAMNGGDFRHYLVQSDQGARKQCAAMPCRLTRGDGVLNAVDQVFTVTAVNSIGSSPPSDPSNSVYPDQAPGQVRGLTVEAISPAGRSEARQATEGLVRVRWTGVDNDGSAITGFELDGLPSGPIGPGVGEVVLPAPTSTDACVNVRAINTVGSGPPVGRAPCARPYAYPIITGARTTATGNGQGTISWDATGNGRPLTSWSVRGCNDPTGTAPPSAPVTLTSCPTDAAITLEIVVRNEAGLETIAPYPVEGSFYEPPVITGTPQLTALRGAVRMDGAPAHDKKNRDVRWYYRWPGGNTWAALPFGSAIPVNDLYVGVSIVVKACNGESGETSCSSEAESTSAVPWGAPGRPTGPSTGTSLTRLPGEGPNGTDAVQLTFTWQPPDGSQRSYVYRAWTFYGDSGFLPLSGGTTTTPKLEALDFGSYFKVEVCDAQDRGACSDVTEWGYPNRPDPPPGD